jgi:hypothetical protein
VLQLLEINPNCGIFYPPGTRFTSFTGTNVQIMTQEGFGSFICLDFFFCGVWIFYLFGFFFLRYFLPACLALDSLNLLVQKDKY